MRNQKLSAAMLAVIVGVTFAGCTPFFDTHIDGSRFTITCDGDDSLCEGGEVCCNNACIPARDECVADVRDTDVVSDASDTGVDTGETDVIGDASDVGVDGETGDTGEADVISDAFDVDIDSETSDTGEMDVIGDASDTDSDTGEADVIGDPDTGLPPGRVRINLQVVDADIQSATAIGAWPPEVLLDGEIDGRFGEEGMYELIAEPGQLVSIRTLADVLFGCPFEVPEESGTVVLDRFSKNLSGDWQLEGETIHVVAVCLQDADPLVRVDFEDECASGLLLYFGEEFEWVCSTPLAEVVVAPPFRLLRGILASRFITSGDWVDVVTVPPSFSVVEISTHSGTFRLNR